MFDKFINWISQYPYLHVFYLTFIFFGLFVGWVFIMLPFYIYDHGKEDFFLYFNGVKEIWDQRKAKR